MVPEGQEWFWTPEWQAGEREVEEDIRAGRLGGPFSTVDELFNYLEGLDER